jgi:hypothetical protein
MPENKPLVAICNGHTEAENAIKALQRSGFETKTLEVAGEEDHSEKQPIEHYSAGERIKHWRKMGAMWGGIWGLLLGATFFGIPGVGPVPTAASVVSWIVGTLAATIIVGGISAVGTGLLHSMGVRSREGKSGSTRRGGSGRRVEPAA